MTLLLLLSPTQRTGRPDREGGGTGRLARDGGFGFRRARSTKADQDEIKQLIERYLKELGRERVKKALPPAPDLAMRKRVETALLEAQNAAQQEEEEEAIVRLLLFQ